MNQNIRRLSYQLTVIAETGTRFSDFAPYVASINNKGIVAFQAARTGGGTGIYTGDGEKVSSILETDEAGYCDFNSHPDINDHNEICCYAVEKSSQACVVFVSDGKTQSLTDTSDLFQSIGPLGPTMNDAGTVAFRAETQPGQHGIFLANRKEVTTVALTNHYFIGFQGLPVINQRGTIAFRADLADGGHGIYTCNNDAASTIAVTDTRFSELARFPDMNDNETVVFCATLQNGDAGVFMASNGDIISVATKEDGFESFRGALINNPGRIIFYATPIGGTLGIYGGKNIQQDKILSIGDSLFDSVVTEFALNPVSWNDKGQIAIRVRLTNEKQLILRADPIE